jgi:outer membrane protein
MKKFVWLFIAVLFLGGNTAFAAPEAVKLGYVDLARALNESEPGKKAKADLESLIKQKQTGIDEKGKAIEKLRGDLEKQASVLSADARKLKEDELERLIRDYQRVVSDSQNEVKKKEGELTNDIIGDLRGIIQKIGQDEGYTMILENADGQILFAQKDIDLTDTVIKRFNESRSKGKK